MNLKMSSFDRALSFLSHRTMLRSDEMIRYPSVVEDYVNISQYNPSVELKWTLDRLNSHGSAIFIFDLAMQDYLDRVDEFGVFGPMSALMKYQDMVFISTVEEIREFIIKTICRIYYEKLEQLPEKIRKKRGDTPISEPTEADLFSQVDTYFRGNICEVREKIVAELGVDIIPSRITLLRTLRMSEIRNCHVHFGGSISRKFLELVGTKVENRRGPFGEVKSHLSFATLVYVSKLLISMDKQFLKKYKIPRAYLDYFYQTQDTPVPR